MSTNALLNSQESLTNLWKVFTLFLIPIGGGIPGGVLLAQKYAISWPVMMVLYLISDVILALIFEPLMMLIIALGKHVTWLARMSAALKKSTQKSIAHYGTSLGPLALVLISFGIDPMTGRAAGVAAGHGFLMGWVFAIAGDMIYFALIMASTLWLSNILGDGTWATIIILVVMMAAPPVIKRIRSRFSRSS